MKNNGYPEIVGNLNTTYDYEKIISNAANAETESTKVSNKSDTKFPSTTKVNKNVEGPRLTLKRTGTRHK